MKVVKPEIEEVTEKKRSKRFPMKRQQATMEIYRKAGINQMAGCFTSIGSDSYFLCIFRFFPNMIDLERKSFLVCKRPYRL